MSNARINYSSKRKRVATLAATPLPVPPPTHISESSDEHALPGSGGHGDLLDFLEPPHGDSRQNSHTVGHVAAITLLHLDGELLHEDVGLDLQSDPVLHNTRQ